MKKYIFSGVLTLLLVGVVAIPSVNAETTSNTAMLEQIKALMAKLEDLQKQLATIRGEVKSVLKEGLSEGMTDADIAKLQELLATDPTIYPEGKKTGYFGPLTREAIKRFQARHELEITGKVDDETHDMLEEYLHDGFGDKIPAGLLRAPGIMKKVQDRYFLGCDKRHGGGHGMGPLCKKWKENHQGDDKGGKNDNNGHASTTKAFDVVVKIKNGDTTVTFTYLGKNYEATTSNSTNSSDVLASVAEKLNVSVSNLDKDLKDAIEKKLSKAIDGVKNTSKSAAKSAINDAQDAIDEAQNALDDASGNVDDAQSSLDDANSSLDDAQSAFDDAEYTKAKSLAHDAENLANDAIDAL